MDYPIIKTLPDGRVSVRWDPTHCTTFADQKSADVKIAEFSAKQQIIAAEKAARAAEKAHLEPKSVIIYTDGACSGNGTEEAHGGWAAILKCGEHTKEISGWEAPTTNNRMELMSVIKGLEALKSPCNVLVYSDSRYVVDGIEKGWAQSWRSNNWIKSDKKRALNSDLWGQLLDLITGQKSVTFLWVKGHSGDPLNERVDKMATDAIKNSGK